ncbi:C-terminal binding protein [Mariniphaga sediminis]|uniref:C-terminal binding protein n=1 Tax=Mariniphaga sediminis TaxID=1628158 RepID=A0A399CXT7_9BACT|nr:C-terminal binding protein [Mariniphaga sediminis]RIH63973.1 C-terminal binding protein [Mariniphaga sediminis]
MEKRPVVARLNASTFPMSSEEKKILSRVNADIIEIEGETDEEILSLCREVDAIMIVSSYLRGAVIKAMENLKIISRLGTGVDKIDMDEATRQGIIVTNLPDFSTDEVADHTMALLLSVARRLKYYEAMMRKGQRPGLINGMHRLSVQKLGVIGFGRIGRAVVKRAKGFGMDILVYDPAVSSEDVQNEGVRKVDFETILTEPDYLCLLCPLTDRTRGMIKMEELKKMKPTAVLINTGRGELLSEHDLSEALRTGVIRYAAVDVFGGINVFAETGFPVNHPYFSLDNILLTPHVSALSEESLKDARTGGAEAVVKTLSGKYPAHIVNPGVQSGIKLVQG